MRMKFKRVCHALLTTAVSSSSREFRIVNFSEIYFVGFEKRQTILVSSADIYKQPTTLKEIQMLGFYAFSRSNLVNLNEYERLDVPTRTLLFKSGAACMIADKYVPVLEMLLRNISPTRIDWPMIAQDVVSEDVVQIALKDVDYVDLDGRIPVYNVGSARYRHLTLVEDFESPSLDELGFVHVDRGSFVNLRKVSYFDRRNGRLYFEEFDRNIYASIARIHYKFVEEMLERLERS